MSRLRAYSISEKHCGSTIVSDDGFGRWENIVRIQIFKRKKNKIAEDPRPEITYVTAPQYQPISLVSVLRKEKPFGKLPLRKRRYDVSENQMDSFFW